MGFYEAFVVIAILICCVFKVLLTIQAERNGSVYSALFSATMAIIDMILIVALLQQVGV